jgi:hypothetical protein
MTKSWQYIWIPGNANCSFLKGFSVSRSLQANAHMHTSKYSEDRVAETHSDGC